MPAQVPQASFQAISPDLDIRNLVESTPNFQYVDRVSCETVQQNPELFEKLVHFQVIKSGKPLVVEGYQDRLQGTLFSAGWLKNNLGKTFELARDLSRKHDVELSVEHYLKNMPKLANQWNAKNCNEPGRQRLYMKDIDCPAAWENALRKLIPPSLFYLNGSTGDKGGPGAVSEGGEASTSAYEDLGAATAGDLMSSLPPEMRAQNLMCYIGHEGTYTPAHREMCASLGQNIMVEASGNGVDPWGAREKPGSSLWFMTETKDRHLVAEYWISILGHDIEVESHFAQINAWKKAPFTTYVVEQRPGDFILIPPLAPHQVWNRGTRTMKVAWNRTTVETLDMAINEALPRARMVCRDEQYKNKAIIFFTLQKYAERLTRILTPLDGEVDTPSLPDTQAGRKVDLLKHDFRHLFALFSDILVSEMLDGSMPPVKTPELLPFDSNVTCAYCRCNIFNRFLTCPTCIKDTGDGEEDAYDICMECYAMGRSCACISNLDWIEQFEWDHLVSLHEDFRQIVLRIRDDIRDDSPQPLDEMRKRLTRKSLAQVCQEQLLLRPWHDVTKPPVEPADDDIADADGEDRKRKRRKKKSAVGECRSCHVCLHQDAMWKLAKCGCGSHYCYGVLFRAFDLMPLQVMEDPSWTCPKCLKICSCGRCWKDSRMTPHKPKGTLVGHDTKKIADPRSVESLVDFSRSNLTWVSKGEDEEAREATETRCLKRLKEKADIAKATDESSYANLPRSEGIIDARSSPPTGPIDPNLEVRLDTGESRPTTTTERSMSMLDISRDQDSSQIIRTTPKTDRSDTELRSNVTENSSQPEDAGNALIASASLALLGDVMDDQGKPAEAGPESKGSVSLLAPPTISSEGKFSSQGLAGQKRSAYDDAASKDASGGSSDADSEPPRKAPRRASATSLVAAQHHQNGSSEKRQKVFDLGGDGAVDEHDRPRSQTRSSTSRMNSSNNGARAANNALRSHEIESPRRKTNGRESLLEVLSSPDWTPERRSTRKNGALRPTSTATSHKGLSRKYQEKATKKPVVIDILEDEDDDEDDDFAEVDDNYNPISVDKRKLGTTSLGSTENREPATSSSRTGAIRTSGSNDSIAAGESIFSRPENAGRRIRIISAAKAAQRSSIQSTTAPARNSTSHSIAAADRRSSATLSSNLSQKSPSKEESLRQKIRGAVKMYQLESIAQD